MPEMKKQVFNPYLPLQYYIPDGEPHVFGDRVYVYGSHDREGGDAFCVLDYDVFSAPVTDLTDWRREGTAYRKTQDPTLSEKYRDMYAPDVVRGNDGRYYLYYALAGGCFTGPIHVAVSSSPAGPFTYLGCVRNQDGSDFTRKITFDPGVINDDGVIRLYFGWSLAVDSRTLEMLAAQGADQESSRQTKEAGGQPDFKEMLLRAQTMMFEKTREEVEQEPDGIMGAFMVELEDDMLTVKTEPVLIVPGQFTAEGTSFENHAFFEASSIRKVGETYYFIYSSQVQHELCYATSPYPDRDFAYGGVIVSNGDIGLEGRKEEERLAMTGNNHGSVEWINGNWYIFYHRQTHKTTYSRQGCAERITILPDGSIPQVPMTSCGLNGGPLEADGSYPAVIACNLTNGHMPHTGTEECKERVPYITNEGEERFIADIEEGTLIGYKYFSFTGPVRLRLTVRGQGEGYFQVKADGEPVGRIQIENGTEWGYAETEINVSGEKALYLEYRGKGLVQLRELAFCSVK